MKKIILLFLLLFIAAVPNVANAHLTPEQRKEYREFKMKYLAQEMGIKEDVRQKFYETYNQLSDERRVIRHQIRDIDKKIKENSATEEDYTKLNNLRDQEAEIDKKYDSRFATFLSGKEIFKMKEAEKTFRNKLQEMKSKRNKKR